MVGYKIKNRKDMLTMKKLLCVIMVVAMIATLSTSVFAGTIKTENGLETSDVKAKYQSVTPSPEYHVDVVWGAMEFEYNASGRLWDEENHKWYDDPANAAEWNPVNGDTITLANHSSEAVKATFSFEAIDGYSLTGKFTHNSAELTAALELEIPKADTTAKEYVVTFEPVGDLSDTHSADAYAKIGTITVQLG